MGALFVLVLISATIIPLLTIVYSERMTIREEIKALSYVEGSLHEFVSDGVQVEKVINQMEIKSELIKTGVVRNCVRLTGSNGRTYEHCFLAAS